MIRLILLDLDDTLLGGSMAAFWSDYIPTMGRWMSDQLDMPDFLARVFRATEHVVARGDPTRTNLERFLEAFGEGTDVDAARVVAAFDDYYTNHYATLARTTRRLPAARRLVAWLFDNGYPVGIATNPLFPRTAVEQRLAWAGVPVSAFDYALVTTLENMHFAKPQPAYYEEILERTGFSPEEALMVGDDLDDDMAAAKAGLRFYWVRTPENATATPPPDAPIAGTGTLDELTRRVCDEGWLRALD